MAAAILIVVAVLLVALWAIVIVYALGIRSKSQAVRNAARRSTVWWVIRCRCDRRAGRAGTHR